MKVLFRILTVLILFIFFGCQKEEINIEESEKTGNLEVIISKKGLINGKPNTDVYSPGGGVYNPGDVVDIMWGTLACIGCNGWSSTNVNIDLYNDSYLVMRLASNFEYYGNQYNWTIPNLPQNGSNFRIKVSSADPGAYPGEKESYSAYFTIEGSTPEPNWVNLVVNDSYLQLGEIVSFTSTPAKDFSYTIRIKYTLYGQVQYQTAHKNSGSSPLISKTSSVTLYDNPGLAYKTIILQVVHNGIVIKQYNKTLFPAPTVNVILNDSYPRLGETVSITSTPSNNANVTYSVRIKYTLYGQVQYQQVHTATSTKTSAVTLWNNSGLAYSNMVLQVVRNGIVTDEYIRGVFP